MSNELFNRNIKLSAKRVDESTSEDSADNLILDFPFSSEEPYARSNWVRDDPWVEVLGHKSDEVDLTRLNAGAPVIINHGNGKTSDVPYLSVGITERAWVEDGRGWVRVKFSRREGMGPILQDIQDGIIANVSVGYNIAERALTKRNAEMPDEYRVTNWLPMEITLCDLPADATVGIGRSINDEVEMENNGIAAPELQRSVEPQVDIEKIKTDALTAERKRMTEIKKLVRSVALGDDFADDLIERGLSLDVVSNEIINKLAERTTSQEVSSRADIHTTRDETETKRELMTEALMYRANPSIKLTDGARQYAGLSLIELARENLSHRGVAVKGLDRMQLAQRAFEGTSDLPSVLANVANKTLRMAYEAAPRTFTSWARQTSASDFKQISRASLSDAPALKKVTENGEFERGAVTDGKEVYQLATYGKIIGLTRQAIINDDLSAFTRLPAAMATAAANLESDTVYAILTANANMGDGVALFHANHGNLTGTGTAISVDSLGVARALMQKQKTPQSAVMNIRPRFLIVPAVKLTLAQQMVGTNYVASQSSVINPFAGTLEVVSEARLDDNSATAWYLVADPSAIDTVEYCYLEGQQGAYIETRQGFEVDGMEIKVRLDFAAKAIDHRGIYKNVGA